MLERFIDTSDDQSSAECNIPRMLEKLAAIDAKRVSILQTAGEINISTIGRQTDQLRFDYGNEGEVKYEVDLLSSCIVAVRSQLSTIESRVERIQAEKSEPQQIYKEATEALTAIDERKIEIIGKIRELEIQRSTIPNQKMLQDLKIEKDVTSNEDYRSALDGKLFAQHSIVQLDQVLALVLSDASKCTDKLALYSTAIDQLRDKVDQTESALIVIIQAIDNFTKVADEGVQELDIPLPEKLQNIDMYMSSRPVSYGDYIPIRDAKMQQSAGLAFELPDDMINFTDSSSTTYVDVPYIYEKPPEPEPQLSLEAKFREAKARNIRPARVTAKIKIWNKKRV